MAMADPDRSPGVPGSSRDQGEAQPVGYRRGRAARSYRSALVFGELVFDEVAVVIEA
jgi:hypothetical protein